MDMRGHGKSSHQDESDLSAQASLLLNEYEATVSDSCISQTLTEDIVAVWDSLQKEDSVSKHPLVMVGHSMGAAMAVRAAATGRMARLEGIVVIDVVEGTAIGTSHLAHFAFSFSDTASLPYMRSVIKKRPTSFSSLESAVDWALAAKMCKQEESAAISIPSMLVAADGEWHWRTPLLSSEPYWTEWYLGLSELFLRLSIPKLLCLAGTDRLDKILTVGQMQGKFQLALMPTAGHAIHEDDPQRVAQLLTQFIAKFRIGQSPLPFLHRK